MSLCNLWGGKKRERPVKCLVQVCKSNWKGKTEIKNLKTLTPENLIRQMLSDLQAEQRGIYQFVIQMKSDTMSADSLDIKDVNRQKDGVCIDTTHSSTCFQQRAHVTLGSDFTTSQNNMIIMCSAAHMTGRATECMLVLNTVLVAKLSVICFLPMTALGRFFEINSTPVVKQPCVHPFF